MSLLNQSQVIQFNQIDNSFYKMGSICFILKDLKYGK